MKITKLETFIVDGGCAPVVEQHEKLKRTLERGSVHPRTLRLGDGVVQRGYRGGDLIDAFARYL